MSATRKSPGFAGRLRGLGAALFGMPAGERREAMRIEPLEARILHSADLGAGLLGATAPLPEVEQRQLDDAGEFASAATRTEQLRQLELVFIDAATPDYGTLLDDIAAQAGERRMEVIVLDASRDGIAQISEALAGRQDVAAMHVISHGSEGTIRLGNAMIDAATLGAQAAQIRGWSGALSEDADLLIYGCKVAASADGRALVGALADLTGADVAASDDPTGAATAGGDWKLEYADGHIETGVAFGVQAQAQWTGLLANASPVLSGANDLAGIAEDPAANPGTLVSDLIAGHVTDADPGALTGMAVTAVDNSNGTWQYSTDGGGSWSSFGAPSATNARLLAADANTYVRFVPNADWNGSVSNGLTFRAWDQTSGTAGGTADTTSTTSTVLDAFSAVSYTNNDGSASWSTGWVDSDGSPSSGNISIAGGQLEFRIVLGGNSIYREADLTGATSATLSLSYDNQFLIGLGGNVELQVSDDGGGSYTTLHTFSQSNTGTGTLSFDITAFISADTRVRFLTAGIAIPQVLDIDDVQISYVTPLASGITGFSSALASSSITVAAVNDAPAGVSNTVTTTEDTAYVFSIANFGFSDTHDTPANSLQAVRIGTLPATGSLTLSGAAVSAGQFIAATDISAGNFAYLPAVNMNGAGTAAFTFQVQDDGGGMDLDPVARTMTIDVTAVNDAPAGTDSTVTATEDTAYVFAAGDFGFTDPDDVSANALLAVKITTLPGAGTLTLNGVAVVSGQFINVSDINAGNLAFTPASNASGTGYASLRFQVQDDGGGTDLDPVTRTLTIDVGPVNDPPTGSSNTVSTVEDTGYIFAAADFGFSDPDDLPADTLLAVCITSLPTAGTLTLGGVAVTAGQFIDVADINAGLVVFTPAADASGTAYASFNFQVQDDGGGADLSVSAATMTIDVSAANDAPVLTTNIGVAVGEAGSAAIGAAMLQATDIDNTLAQLAYTVSIGPLHGHLELAGAPGVVIAGFTQDDIANNRLVYVHDGSETLADGFTFSVSDGAGGSIGGTSFAVTVNAVNDAPINVIPGAQGVTSGTALVFSAAGGNALSIGDPDAGANPVQVSLSAADGVLTLASTAGLAFLSGSGAGDSSMAFTGTIASINSALNGLVFSPNAGFTGNTSLTLIADDLGNTGSGGALNAGGTIAISVMPPPLPDPPFDPGPVILDPTPPVIVSPVIPAAADPAPTVPSPSGATEPAPTDGSDDPGELSAHEPDATPADEFDVTRRSQPPGSPGRNAIQTSAGGRGSNVAFGGADLRLLLPAPDQTEFTAGELSATPTDTGATAVQSPHQSQALLSELDRLRDDMQEESKVRFNTVALTTAASLGLSVGYVLWLLRGGVLVSSVLSSLPAWRFVDPLPILGRLEEDDDEDPDESLESMVANRNRASATDDAEVEPA